MRNGLLFLAHSPPIYPPLTGREDRGEATKVVQARKYSGKLLLYSGISDENASLEQGVPEAALPARLRR